jgi:hypothetical protein
MPESIRWQRIGGGGTAIANRVPVAELYGFRLLLGIGAGLAAGRVGYITIARAII